MSALTSVRPGGRLSVVLIEQRAMIRQALAAWFRQNCQELDVVALAHPGELIKHARATKDVDIVILGVGAARVIDGHVLADIQASRQALADLPLVVLSDREDMEEVVEAIRRGARGFIPTSLELDDALEALRFVSAGGTFVPAQTLIRCAGDRTAAPDGNAPQSGRQPFGRLTPREMEVLARLRQGKPNKVIAHELDISESTVKVFVRRILMKVRAVNRTEVAYLTHRQFDKAEPDLV